MKMTRLMVSVAAVLVGQLAFAHAELTSSVPADGATLAAAPSEFVLRFTEPVRLTALAVQKMGGTKQDLDPLPSAANNAFTVASPTLADGRYTLTWRALSEDTHVMTGELVFAVGAGQMAPAHSQGSMSGHMPGHEDGGHMEHSEAH